MKFPKPGFYYCDLWRMNYWFCLGWPMDVMNAYLKSRFGYCGEITEFQDGKLWECLDDKNGSVVQVLWIRDPKDLSALVHECVHAAHFTLEKRGFKPDFDNDEPIAYLVGEIFDRATEGMYGSRVSRVAARKAARKKKAGKGSKGRGAKKGQRKKKVHRKG